MEAKRNIGVSAAALAIAAAIFLFLAVPLFGQRFERWPPSAAFIYPMALLIAPLAAAASIILWFISRQYRERSAISILWFLGAVISLLLFGIFIYAFTSSP